MMIKLPTLNGYKKTSWRKRQIRPQDISFQQILLYKQGTKVAQNYAKRILVYKFLRYAYIFFYLPLVVNT